MGTSAVRIGTPINLPPAQKAPEEYCKQHQEAKRFPFRIGKTHRAADLLT